ncbi:hypothetical protein MPNT_300011 [Candidatus Methylacidithermus pantelleriae]|uniref:Uncharacterized protein n=1 Tax=Candidatus Methylacidithermus pantelleriae TaxID=2744239 RepID=A0A8J2FR77_9BACT|nr:hypothetical protein MPNT_300011 [Candidatus Methylacidithermus pantelleriae]
MEQERRMFIKRVGKRPVAKSTKLRFKDIDPQADLNKGDGRCQKICGFRKHLLSFGPEGATSCKLTANRSSRSGKTPPWL